MKFDELYEFAYRKYGYNSKCYNKDDYDAHFIIEYICKKIEKKLNIKLQVMGLYLKDVYVYSLKEDGEINEQIMKIEISIDSKFKWKKWATFNAVMDSGERFGNKIMYNKLCEDVPVTELEEFIPNYMQWNKKAMINNL